MMFRLSDARALILDPLILDPLIPDLLTTMAWPWGYSVNHIATRKNCNIEYKSETSAHQTGFHKRTRCHTQPRTLVLVDWTFAGSVNDIEDCQR